jgi:hypothetical protein
LIFVVVRGYLMPPSMTVPAQRNEISVVLAIKVVVVVVVDFGGLARAIECLAPMVNGSRIGDPDAISNKRRVDRFCCTTWQ